MLFVFLKIHKAKYGQLLPRNQHSWILRNRNHKNYMIFDEEKTASAQAKFAFGFNKSYVFDVSRLCSFALFCVFWFFRFRNCKAIDSASVKQQFLLFYENIAKHWISFEPKLTHPLFSYPYCTKAMFLRCRRHCFFRKFWYVFVFLFSGSSNSVFGFNNSYDFEESRTFHKH